MANVVVLKDDSTGRVWNFGTAPGGTFIFGPPYNQGNYTLINMSANNITVGLLGQTYTVPPHTTWNFVANTNVAPIKPTVQTLVPAKQTKAHGGESVPTSSDSYEFTAAQAQPPAPPLEEEVPGGPIQPSRALATAPATAPAAGTAAAPTKPPAAAPVIAPATASAKPTAAAPATYPKGKS